MPVSRNVGTTVEERLFRAALVAATQSGFSPCSTPRSGITDRPAIIGQNCVFEETAMEPKQHHCETCRLRKLAERKPQSLIARIWRWHTGWCPGWKAYQRSLEEAEKKSAA